MAVLTAYRKTYQQIFNEVRRKNDLNEVSALDGDTLGKVMIDYMNDVLTEVSDYGNWQEMYREESFTAQSSVADYVFDTSANVKNIFEINFGTPPNQQIAAMRLVTLDDILRLNRVRSRGVPTQYAYVGVDNAATGNPRVRVFPTPVTAQTSGTFNLAYYKKPAIVTAGDTSVLAPFPSRPLAQGLFAYVKKDEEKGDPTGNWVREYEIFKNMTNEAYNRFNGDTGSDTYFIPTRGRRSR